VVTTVIAPINVENAGDAAGSATSRETAVLVKRAAVWAISRRTVGNVESVACLVASVLNAVHPAEPSEVHAAGNEAVSEAVIAVVNEAINTAINVAAFEEVNTVREVNGAVALANVTIAGFVKKILSTMRNGKIAQVGSGRTGAQRNGATRDPSGLWTSARSRSFQTKIPKSSCLSRRPREVSAW